MWQTREPETQQHIVLSKIQFFNWFYLFPQRGNNIQKISVRENLRMRENMKHWSIGREFSIRRSRSHSAVFIKIFFNIISESFLNSMLPAMLDERERKSALWAYTRLQVTLFSWICLENFWSYQKAHELTIDVNFNHKNWFLLSKLSSTMGKFVAHVSVWF